MNAAKKPLHVRILRSLAESVAVATVAAVVLSAGLGIATYIVHATATVQWVSVQDSAEGTSTDLGPTILCETCPPKESDR